MFETVVPETFERRSKRVFYETLPVSLALHAIVASAAIAATVWNVAFPTDSPRISVAYSLTRVPEPPPPPPPPPKAEAPRPQPVTPPPSLPLAQIVAPTVIPDLIPAVEPPPPEPPPPQPVAQAVPGAVPGGSTEGVIGGEIGGKVRGIKGGVFFPEDGRMHFDREDKLPMEEISKDYPEYPSEAKKNQIEGTVVLKYVIGTNGRVKDVEVIDHGPDTTFDDAAVSAIRRWRFRPMIKDGKRIEVVHELAVNFELIRR